MSIEEDNRRTRHEREASKAQRERSVCDDDHSGGLIKSRYIAHARGLGFVGTVDGSDDPTLLLANQCSA